MNNNVELNREKYIGGSDYPIITGISKYKKVNELAGEKAGVILNEFNGNIYTDFGNFAEPIIREYLNDTYNTKFKEDTFIEKLDGSLPLRGNVDGYDKQLNLILEIKTTSDFEKNQNVYEAQVRFYQKLVKNSKAFIIAIERTNEMLELFKNNELEELKQIILDKLNNNEFDYLELKKVLTKEKKEIENNCIEFTNLVNEIALLGTIEINQLPQKYTEYALDISREFLEFKRIEEQLKQKREQLFELMSEYNVKSISNDYATITRVDPTKDKEYTNYILNSEIPPHQLMDLINKKIVIVENKKRKGAKGFVKITEKK
jgi:predicted phage-related endonuclease|nr:MAG TPA: Exonuclease [Caudoviricetes sp.]